MSAPTRIRRAAHTIALGALVALGSCKREAAPVAPVDPRDRARVIKGPEPGTPDLSALARTARDHAEPEVEPEPTPILVAAPPFARRVAEGLAPGSRPRVGFRVVRTVKGIATDPGAWRSAHALHPPAGPAEPLPPGLPPSFGGRVATHRFAGDPEVFAYASDPSTPNLLIGVDRGGRSTFVLDFAAWTRPPKVKAGDEPYVGMGLHHATAVGSVLYACHYHRTYARSSAGKNGFLVALSIPDGALLWSSEPQVCNANFVVDGELIVTGYGFTGEPDYLYVLDASDGAVIGRTRLHTAAEEVAVAGDTLLVHAYDRDVEIAWTVTGRRGPRTVVAPIPARERPLPVEAPADRPPDPPRPPATATPSRPSEPALDRDPCEPLGRAVRDPESGRIRCRPRVDD